MARNVSGWGKFFMVIGVILFIVAVVVGVLVVLDAYIPAVHTFIQKIIDYIKPTTVVISAKEINYIPYLLSVK